MAERFILCSNSLHHQVWAYLQVKTQCVSKVLATRGDALSDCHAVLHLVFTGELLPYFSYSVQVYGRYCTLDPCTYPDM